MAIIFRLLFLGWTAGAAATVSGNIRMPGGKNPENSVVFLAGMPGRTFTLPAEPAIMDQKQKNFVPHVLVVLPGQRVVFPNTDLVRHNVFSASKIHPFNLGIYPPGFTREQLFDRPGVVSLLCNVHTEMSGFIVVAETPYWSLVGADGKFEIRDVPLGTRELVAWHEGLPDVRDVVEIQGDRVTHDFVLKRPE